MRLELFEKEQIATAAKVIIKDDFKKLKTIAGCHQAFADHQVISAIVVCDRDLNIIEKQVAVVREGIPYRTGFRYFREAAAIAAAFAKLERAPDVVIFSAHGILHPLRIGLASHVGVALNIPTIGVGKMRLVGQPDKNGKIWFEGEMRGELVKTRDYSKPLIVSPGHRVSLETAAKLVSSLTKHPHKLPEPLHLAARLADRTRKITEIEDTEED